MQSATHPTTQAARAQPQPVTQKAALVHPTGPAKPQYATKNASAPAASLSTRPAPERHQDPAYSDDEYYYYRNPSRIDSAYVNEASRTNATTRSAIVLGTDDAPIVEAIPVRRTRRAPPPQKRFVLTTEMCLNMSACPRCRGQGCATCEWGMRRASYADYRRDMKDQGEHVCTMM